MINNEITTILGAPRAAADRAAVALHLLKPSKHLLAIHCAVCLRLSIPGLHDPEHHASEAWDGLPLHVISGHAKTG